VTILSGIASHTGNAYSYYVGAYCKTHILTIGKQPINLTSHDFDIEPRFPPEISPLGVALSLDLVASRSDSEYFAECKHDQNLRSLEVSSREFKEGILEFIGLEGYRKVTFRKQLEYVFVSNSSMNRLVGQVSSLRTASTANLDEFRKDLIDAARKKWKRFKGVVSEKDVRSVLGRIILLKVDDGALSEAESDPRFQEALKQIASKARRGGIGLPLNLAAELENVIAVVCDPLSDDTVKFETLGLPIVIQNNIWTELVRLVELLSGIDTVRRYDSRTLTFLKTLRIESGQPTELAGRFLTETVNTQIFSKKFEGSLFSHVSLDDKSILVCNTDWLLALSRLHRSLVGDYNIAKIVEAFPLAITYRAVELMLSEAKRVRGLIIDEGSFQRD
jgi:hypothetical protein